MITLTKEDLTYIEDLITELKNSNKIDDVCTNLRNTLSRIFTRVVDVKVSTNTIDKMFVVNVLNDCGVEAVDKLIDSVYGTCPMKEDDFLSMWLNITNNSTRCIKIEFDIMAIKSNYTPSELTAAMIYELYRMCYAVTTPLLIFDEVNKRIKTTTIDNKAILAMNLMNSLTKLVTIAVMNSKTFNVHEHCECDDMCVHKFIDMMGYRDAYLSFVNKTLKSYNTDIIHRGNDDVKKDVKITLLWLINMINELQYNKRLLKDTLNDMLITNPSDMSKQFVSDALGVFFGKVTDKYREILSEQWNDKPVDKYTEEMTFSNVVKAVNKVVTEARDIFLDKHGKVKKVSQLDIDVIAVDVERITTHDDKIYLLDRIYDKIHLVEAGLEYIESGNKDKVQQSKNTLMDYKRQLEDLRANVLATRIIEKDYGVFVKYPKGYEG